MLLKEYLQLNKISSKQFSRILKVSEISISRYINGNRIPNKKILKAIFKETNGFVSANDFLINDIKNIELNNDDKDDIKKLVREIELGSIKSLAKAITLVESSNLLDQKKSDFLISILPKKNNTIRIGISGVPGVGKSTFIESLGLYLLEENFKVAVLAVDPSSQKTGGSILGDKTRMERLSIKKNAYIRPSPSQGHLGGVTKSTRETINCVEAAGFDVVFVETMGVGQAETAVHSMVDIFLVLLLPSGGDDLQGIKKGIIELADLLVVNKADGSLLSTAKVTVNDYKNAISIINSARDSWKPKVEMCSSINHEGIANIWNRISGFIKERKKRKYFLENRINQNKNWMWDLVDQKIKNFIEKDIKNNQISYEIEKKLSNNKLNSINAANEILGIYLKNFK